MWLPSKSHMEKVSSERRAGALSTRCTLRKESSLGGARNVWAWGYKMVLLPKKQFKMHFPPSASNAQELELPSLTLV